MNCKPLYLILFCLFLSSTIKAQDSTVNKKIREFHLAFGSFSPANVQIKHKTKIGYKTFFKVSLINLGYNENNTSNQSAVHIKNRQYSAGIELGLEWRTNLYKQFAFYHGPNISFEYTGFETKTYMPNTSNGNSQYRGGIPYTLGLLFNLKNHFYFSAEINPGIFYSTQGVGYSENFSIGFNNRIGQLALVYRL